ncbi:MAG: DUF4145 domain-containing protein [Planctomycetaceae bacterium]
MPSLWQVWADQTSDHANEGQRYWGAYCCATCGGIVIGYSWAYGMPLSEIWPKPNEVAEEVPQRARRFLEQAIGSLHAPAGAVMLAASSIDAMLKDMGYKEGSLYKRIDKAATEHLITREMAAWAHEIRLDANDQRHADEDADLPSAADAAKATEFALALAQFLFVLPARVERGRTSN